MAKFVKWLKETVGNIVDPDKEQRVQELVALLKNGLHSQRRSFSLRATLKAREYREDDLELAKERVYRAAVQRGWQDGKLTESEQDVAKWVSSSLEISADKTRSINVECARSCFAATLARAMEDGDLDQAEADRLVQIAGAVGFTLPEFVPAFFRSEGEGFLRSVFLACVADGHISQYDWNYLLATTQKLGLSHEDMLVAIQPQARQFVEHVLADAKSDCRLTDHEEATLNWLVDNLGLPANYHRYINSEIAFLKAWTDIHEGRLPSIPAPMGIETRAGEIVHHYSRAKWRQTRQLKSGPRTYQHHGVLTMTDNRLIFASPTKSQNVNFRKVVSHRGGANWIEVQVDGKPTSTFLLGGDLPTYQESSEIPYAIFQTAVAMANQTKVARQSGTRSRHIPRNVRQRVWQRYGGRCAECEAEDYLEFDHIVPVAKGGSNLDANVQLLCRRCNLTKSDKI